MENYRCFISKRTNKKIFITLIKSYPDLYFITSSNNWIYIITQNQTLMSNFFLKVKYKNKYYISYFEEETLETNFKITIKNNYFVDDIDNKIVYLKKSNFVGSFSFNVAGNIFIFNKKYDHKIDNEFIFKHLYK